MALGMSGGREFVLKIVGDATDAIKAVDKVGAETTSMKDKMVGIGKSVATGLAVAAVVDFGRASVNAAMEADESMDKVVSVFGSASQAVVDFSKTTVESMGLSAQDYQAMAAQTGAVMQSMGIDAGDAAKRTETLSQRAADLAAIFGGTAQDAMSTFNKALAGGATKGLQQYGIVVSKAEIEQKALSEGWVDAEGNVTKAGTAMAAQAVIMEKSAAQAGEYAKNSGDLGSQQQQMAARFENLQTTIGNMLLPVLEQLIDLLEPLLNFIQQNINWIAPLVAGITGLVIGIKAWAAAQWLLNSALLANPIGIVVVAVTALVGSIIWAYNNVEWFREAIDKLGDVAVAVFGWIKDAAVTAFNWLKDNWPLVLGILTGPFGLAIAAIVKYWEDIKQVISRAIDGIRWLMNQVWDILTWPFRHAAESISYVWNGVTGIFRGFIDTMRWLFGQIYDIITWPFRRAMDMIKWLWNTTIGGFGFTLPSWIPLVGGKGFRIPEMATGGIVHRPTLALIGEAGPEAVVPLSQYNGGGGGSVVYQVNVYALNATAETGRMIAESLREYNRTSGYQAGSLS